MTKWINVEDNLPPAGAFLIMITWPYIGENVRFPFFKTGFYNVKTKKFIEFNGHPAFTSHGEIESEVTHWIKIPNIPEVKE